jgi:hypothetical protein
VCDRLTNTGERQSAATTAVDKTKYIRGSDTGCLGSKQFDRSISYLSWDSFIDTQWFDSLSGAVTDWLVVLMVVLIGWLAVWLAG